MTEEEIKHKRDLAVCRYLKGERPESICASLGCSRSWLYKWVGRFTETDETWRESQSKRPLRVSCRTAGEVEEIVKLIRLDLYNKGSFCGAQAILWELEDLSVKPLPSLRTINRILSRNALTHRRSGKYEAKGTKYPELPYSTPNQTHQADWVGPCYLKGAYRFYSLNVVDLATARCGLYPSRNLKGQSVLDGFWDIWKRLGIPINLQIDNTLSFFGSHRHPRAMGPLIRLCLHHGVEPWFIPLAEPWRNGVIEKFNDLYQDKFLKKVHLEDEAELAAESFNYEQRHNSTYRYSKLKGKTPVKTLASSNTKLRFPMLDQVPRHPLEKPNRGRYHIVRLIRSDLNLNIFSELFPVSSDLMYQYVVATIDVKEQKLKLYLDNVQVDEFLYKSN